jgi:hypothetical protein
VALACGVRISHLVGGLRVQPDASIIKRASITKMLNIFCVWAIYYHSGLHLYVLRCHLRNLHVSRGHRVYVMGVAGPFTGEAGGRRGKLMVGVAALCRRLSPNGSQSHPVSLWHKRDFVLLWFGQTVSILGSRMSELAIPLLVLAVTHSPVKEAYRKLSLKK